MYQVHGCMVTIAVSMLINHTDSRLPSSGTRATGAWWHSMQWHCQVRPFWGAAMLLSSLDQYSWTEVQNLMLLQRQWPAGKTLTSQQPACECCHASTAFLVYSHISPRSLEPLHHQCFKSFDLPDVCNIRFVLFRNKRFGKLWTLNTKCCQTGAESPMCVTVHLIGAITRTLQIGTATCSQSKVCTAVCNTLWKSVLLHSMIS